MDKEIKKGDRVSKSPMWKYEEAIGTVIKASKDGWVVVKWDGINGDWHYNKEQSKEIIIMDKDNE